MVKQMMVVCSLLISSNSFGQTVGMPESMKNLLQQQKSYSDWVFGSGEKQEVTSKKSEVPRFESAYKINQKAFESAWQYVPPEMLSKVHFSSSDANRIYCPSGAIEDVVFSKEKGIEVTIHGKNAFVKFLVTRRGRKTVYSETPSEFYVICASRVYSILAIPKKIPAVSVHLEGSKKDVIVSNQRLFESLPLEKKVIKLIRYALNDDLPASFTVNQDSRLFHDFKQLHLKLRRTIVVDGEGLRLKEFFISPKQEVTLTEEQFLIPQLTSQPRAVALSDPILSKGETGRLFIVEQIINR